jgi:predicted nucleic acid-binding protein
LIQSTITRLAAKGSASAGTKVDSSIWSLALRRQKGQLSPAGNARVASLQELIRDGRARLIEPIRQELRSGVRDPSQFEKLRPQLRAFGDEPLTVDDYEQAARWSNACRGSGLAKSGVDFLICAAAITRQWHVFTSDQDFMGYARVIPVQLFAPG